MNAPKRAFCIDQQQNKFNAVDATEPSVVHITSVDSSDVVKINLNKNNMCITHFPNQQKGLALWDSGSSVNLISESTINNNTYLRGIPLKIAPRRLECTVGNGCRIYSDKKITFSMYVQKNLFEFTAFVVPTMGGIELVIGTKAMSELEAKLNFKKKVLKFRSRQFQ